MASIRKEGRTWYLRWYENGKQKEKSLGKISERDAKLAKKTKEVEQHTGKRILTSNTVFAIFADQYSQWYAHTYPDSYYRVNQIIDDWLKPEFNSYYLSEITIHAGDMYQAKRKQQGAKAATVRKELQTLHAMLNRAVQWQEIEENPLSGIKYPKVLDSKPPRFYTVDELNKIYQASPEHWHWWKLLANTGVRRTEMRQIRPDEHIDLNRRMLSIVSSEKDRTKSGKWREVPLNDSAMESLDEFDLTNETLFPQYFPSSYSRAFARCVRRADIPKPQGSIHALRHSFCSHLIMNGVDIRTVKDLAGHSTINVTMQYAHLLESHRDSATGCIGL